MRILIQSYPCPSVDNVPFFFPLIDFRIFSLPFISSDLNIICIFLFSLCIFSGWCSLSRLDYSLVFIIHFWKCSAIMSSDISSAPSCSSSPSEVSVTLCHTVWYCSTAIASLLLLFVLFCFFSLWFRLGSFFDTHSSSLIPFLAVWRNI